MQARASDLDIQLLDKKIDQMMPELGFTAEDNDRLVASYRRAPILLPLKANGSTEILSAYLLASVHDPCVASGYSCLRG